MTQKGRSERRVISEIRPIQIIIQMLACSGDGASACSSRMHVKLKRPARIWEVLKAARCKSFHVGGHWLVKREMQMQLMYTGTLPYGKLHASAETRWVESYIVSFCSRTFIVTWSSLFGLRGTIWGRCVMPVWRSDSEVLMLTVSTRLQYAPGG